jgi:DNA-binding transcriptional LysR family regulator
VHFRGLDLNLLIALDVLLRERNITRAGDRLGLSQPATSGALARLREYFHDPLLVQVGRQMLLTPLAETLRDPVADVLRLVQTTVATKTRFDARSSDRRFSIMASDYVFTVFLPEVIQRIEREAPSVTLQLRQLSSGWQDELHRGDVDFLIVPETCAVAGTPRTPLFEDALTCLAWKGNSRLKGMVTIDQFFELGHVVPRLPGVHELAYDESALQMAGRLRRVEIVAPTFALIPRLVVGTDRIATIWSRFAADAERYLPIEVLDPPFEMPRLVELLQWSERAAADPGTIWLRSVIEEVAASVPPLAGKAGVA